MINMITKKLAIMFLIAVFSLAGIIACGGAEDIAGSRGGSYVEPPIDDGGGDDPTDPLGPEENNWDPSDTWNIEPTKGKTFYGSSRRTVFILGVY